MNQDELGRQAQCIWRKGDLEIWARPLWDGTVATALFNRGIVPVNIKLEWFMLDPVLRNLNIKLRGSQSVRDLWKRKTIGSMDSITMSVKSHGAVMLKIGTPVRGDD